MVRYRNKTVRSYRKLIDFIAAKDSAGATKHWKLHMDVAARELLGGGISDKTVVDLFS
jgi:DNA-binding FadR family transcriptional regulator